MTVGELLDFIQLNKLPRDAEVLYQRIEDVYFEKHHWTTIKKEGDDYHQTIKWNEDIDSGKYLDKEQYPMIKPENLIKCTDEDLESVKEQYITSWCAVKYPNDNNLYIDAHY